MPLAPGTKLGPYEILVPLGAGGMGEVYRARDSRLERDVAVKVLPGHLSADTNLRQRLEREARAVSKLSHPHICTLHDIGQQDGLSFLVMELVEGETLEQRLGKGPLPPDQTIRYAAQIADALARAHKSGITHRDLKPANVMLTKAGAKLMDFGLAKQSGPAPLAQALTEMTIEHSKLTSEGALVGTFQYMAPEQLEGKEADARADIFALGEVMYEMATGKPAFTGQSRASLIAAILTSEPPPITQLQPLAPAPLERIVKKCLAKDPDDRWQSASDLASELKWIQEGGSQSTAQAPALPSQNWRARVPWIIAAVAAAAAIGLLVMPRREIHTETSAPRARWILTPPESTSFQPTGDNGGPVALSPDGRLLVFLTLDGKGKTQLWLQALDTLKPAALTGTEGASFPFWSPNSRSIGFFAQGQLKRIDIDSGSVLSLCEVRVARGGSWGADGTILFSSHVNGPLYRVPASGGQPTAVTQLDATQHDTHRWPILLPDGNHFLYFAASHLDLSHSRDGLYIGSLDGKPGKLLVRTHSNGAYANGRVLFLSDNVLKAQTLDLARLELVGQPAVVQNGVEVDYSWWLAVFSVSQGGVLAFAPNQESGNSLVWLNADGKPTGTFANPGRYSGVRLSPDEQHIAVEYDAPTRDIWVYDAKRSLATQLTFGPLANAQPVWSPDGSQIVFASQQATRSELHIRDANGTQPEQVLLSNDAFNFPVDWSPDGKFLLYCSTNADNSHPGLWLLPMQGERTPRRLLDSPLYDSDGRFSPDMKWIAYTSREQGIQRVFATPFPGPGRRVLVSPGGGASPVWRKDGGSIYYSDDTGRGVEETEIRRQGSEFLVGNTRWMVQSLAPAVFQGTPLDVTRDRRILVVSKSIENRTELVIVANWSEGLAK